jgi:hypothetical protein
VFWHAVPAEAYSRSVGAQAGFVQRDWRELSDELQARIIERLGVRRELFEGYRTNPRYKPPDIGSYGTKRLWVDWRLWPTVQRLQSRRTVDQSKLGLGAEFDLETGELEGIEFFDPHLIEALAANTDLTRH